MTDGVPDDDLSLHPGTPYDWVGALSERRASLSPDRIGLVDRTTGERYSYARLDARANRAARLLCQHGVETGDRVAVLSRTRPALIDLFFGTAKVGAVLAPLSHRLPASELSALLATVEPSLLLVEEPFDELAHDVLGDGAFDGQLLSLATDGDHTWEAYEDAMVQEDSPVGRPRLSLADPHLLLHTGGSTGTPKEVVLTHGTILWNSINTITAWGLRGDDVTPLVFPTFHTGGWNVLTAPLFHLGGTVVIAREFDAGDVLRTIQEEAATVLVAVPAMYRLMAEHEAFDDTSLSTIRFAKSGGGPADESTMQVWWDRGVNLSQGYGLTECGPNNFGMPEHWPREKAASVGVPAPHVDVRIVDSNGDPVDAGDPGELQLASPHSAVGYWQDEERTQEVFGSGWVSTGDLARVDEDGYYYVEGRTDNMFVSGGENVYPEPIEAVLLGHESVDAVGVIPIAHERWGKVPKAIIVGDADKNELECFARNNLADYELPRAFAFAEELPTTGPGKLDREALRTKFS